MANEQWIDTTAGRLHVRQWSGAGVPIVLFHDSLGSVALWREFPEALARATGRAVIAYDRLGLGRSDPHPGRLDFDFVASEAQGAFRDLRAQLGFHRFVAFGHSVGGGMAVACAAAYPESCEALITESAQAFVEDRTIEGILAAKAVFARPGQLERLQRHHGDKAAWVLHAWIDTWLAPEFADWNLDALLRQVRCPTLVIHGDQDEYGSGRHPRRIAEHVKGEATLELLPCGHVPHRECMEDVLAIVTRWLARV